MARSAVIGAQVWSLLAVGVGLNLVFGSLIALFKIPLYLDSLGTVLVGVLCGPLAGALAGICGVALLGLTSPTALAFSPVAAVVGLAAGLASKLGAFRRIPTAVVAGGLTGVLGAAAAAPIATYLYGGVTGGGTDILVAVFRALGASALTSSFWQGLAVDPLDKAVTFFVVLMVLRALPRRAITCFPLGERLGFKPAEIRPYQNLRPRHAQAWSHTDSDEAQEGGGVNFPGSSTWLKAVTLISTLAVMAALPPERWHHSVIILGLLLSVTALASPRFCWEIVRKLVLWLAPLSVSLVVISSLLVRREQDVKALWLGLTWSIDGLHEALFFLARATSMLFAVTVFVSTTPLPRIGELMFRLRLPYTLVFVVLNGANLAVDLRHRWQAVEEAQRARGLALPASGMRRWLGLTRLLYPTIGSVFTELPIRAACLQSRGLLSAKPKAELPREWTGEAAPTLLGQTVQVALIFSLWAGYLWL